MSGRPTKADVTPGGDYFPDREVDFIQSGCTLLDCIASGGEGTWPLGRIANIVGDKSVGKTLLAIEAAANFAVQYPKGKIWYREAEAAFDVSYAKVVGLPASRVDFGPDGIESLWNTVEDIFVDLNKCVKYCQEKKVPGLYVIDSLDALSSRVEIGRDINKGSFQLDKQKLLSELFRVSAREVKYANMCVIVISQVRDKIGFVVGKKHTRAGGKALDFYSSLTLWLTHMKTLTRTLKGVKRPVAILVKAKTEKNKISLPFRDCQFKLRFGYGIDDVDSSLDWLAEVKQLKQLELTPDKIGGYLDKLDEATDAERQQAMAKVRNAVIKAWHDVEEGFKPRRSKYG